MSVVVVVVVAVLGISVGHGRDCLEQASRDEPHTTVKGQSGEVVREG
jgi:hypothetical protein